jgi:alpha-amylase
MQTLFIHFQISQPRRLRNYRFFDINRSHNYFDDYQNRYLMNRLAERCYLPANQLLLALIRQLGDAIAFSFTIAGNTLKMFEEYCPQVIQSFQELLNTGRVEMTGGTYTHSLSSLHGKESFIEQIELQEALLQRLFSITPTAFANTEYLYSDEIGEWVAEKGYKTMLSEGARHILGWKNPGFLYCNPYQTELKLLLRHYTLCDDISYRFRDTTWDQYPLTAEKFLTSAETTGKDAPLLNLFFDYETFGEYNTSESGIFDFLKAFISQFISKNGNRMMLPSEINLLDLPFSTLHVPWTVSTSGDEKDTSEWLGNDLQQEAFQQLFKLENLFKNVKQTEAKEAWLELQDAAHFNYMGNRWVNQSSVKHNFDVYSSPYQAFINFMNILTDITLQLKAHK